MEQFETEEQQIEAVKKFWRENGIAIVVGAVVGLGGLWGWRAYSDKLLEKKEVASQAYQEMQETLGSDDANITPIKDFIEQNSESGYAVLAALQVAKVAVERSDYDEAASQLKWAAENSQDKNVGDIAYLRLARVELQLGKHQEALNTLAELQDGTFIGVRKEVEGDIYAAMGSIDKAKAAYISAIEVNSAGNGLQMKIDNLVPQVVNVEG
jgi:predicted negative regulator of RcsB-dependent stress response